MCLYLKTAPIHVSFWRLFGEHKKMIKVYLVLLSFLTVPEFKSGLGHVKLDGVALIPCGGGTNPQWGSPRSLSAFVETMLLQAEKITDRQECICHPSWWNAVCPLKHLQIQFNSGQAHAFKGNI